MVATNGRFDLRAGTMATQKRVRLVDRSDILALNSIAKSFLDMNADVLPN
jgi:hypothetical protein